MDAKIMSKKIWFPLVIIGTLIVSAFGAKITAFAQGELPPDQVEDVGATKIVQGAGVVAHLEPGKWYHINHWCNGCVASVESNYIGTVDEPKDLKIWGTVWMYTRMPTKSEVWDARDYYPTVRPHDWVGFNLIAFETLPESFDANSREVPAPVGSAFQGPNSAGTAVSPTVTAVSSGQSITPVEGKIVAQGEDQMFTLKAGTIYHLNLWWRGDSHEYDWLVKAKEEVGMPKFNGTLEEFTGMPARDMLPEMTGKHVFPADLAKLSELNGKVEQFDINSLESTPGAELPPADTGNENQEQWCVSTLLNPEQKCFNSAWDALIYLMGLMRPNP